jgi:membrane associated rhomboid family serine protease
VLIGIIIGLLLGWLFFKQLGKKGKRKRIGK